MTIFQSVLVLMLAGQIGVPIGLPPLPEDPMMARVAPRECVWYVSWSGTSGLDPKSTNSAEQLLAEPEVRRIRPRSGQRARRSYSQRCSDESGGTIARRRGTGPDSRPFHASYRGIYIECRRRPVRARHCRRHCRRHRRRDREFESDVGRTRPDAATPPRSAPAIRTIDAAPTEAAAGWHKFPSQPPSPIVEWGFRGKYLIVGIGEGSADAILARTKGEPPEWLRAIRKKLPVERVSTLHYVNVKRIVAEIRPYVGTPGPWRELGPELQALKNIREFSCVSGLDGTGCVSKSWVHADDPASPLLGLIAQSPSRPRIWRRSRRTRRWQSRPACSRTSCGL